jgi:hypothetical protein
MPQAWGQSAVATRQKSTARRFVNSCSVRLRTPTMLGARSLAVTFISRPEMAFRMVHSAIRGQEPMKALVKAPMKALVKALVKGLEVAPVWRRRARR